MVKLNNTLSDIANRMDKWESKMKSMEKSFQTGAGTSKGGTEKKKQISSFLRVS